jgi:uncharacterized protein DUF4124
MLFFSVRRFQEASMRRFAAVVVCVLFVSATPAYAEFYRWVDNEGKEFFANDPEKVPQEYRGRASKVQPDPSRVNIEEKTVNTGKATATSGEHRDRHGRGEEYWHKKAANLRLKLRDQQDEYDFVQKQLDDQDRKPKKLSSKKKTRSSLEKKKMKLEKDLARTRRLLEVDLPEEARRADAYPGWLRE